MLVGNKCEHIDTLEEVDDLKHVFRLGFGEPLRISAEHGDGL